MIKVFYLDRYCCALIAGFILLLFYSCRKDTETPVPAIKTADVTYISPTTATCGGIISSEGGSAVTSSGVCWSSDPLPTIEDQKTTDIPTSGSFSSAMTDLIPNAKYFVRAYATNRLGTGYGISKLFITPNGQAPSLTPISITTITQTFAICNINITSDGGLTITLRGVCYSTSPKPTLADNFTTEGTGTGSFKSKISGISSGTTYYVRPYATNSSGTTYGNEVSFAAVEIPSLITMPCNDIQGISAKAGGSVTDNGGDKNIMVGLCWSTIPNPTLSNSFNRSFNSPMTGLSPNTVYFVRAYSTNKAGTAYGNQISFNSGYTMGYPLEGGLVFYNDGNTHGMVCATVDQGSGSPWGCYGKVTYAFATGINSGPANTDTIVYGCSELRFAAKVCSDLKMRKYSDWFLPSIEELNLMYVNLHKNKIGNFKNYYYWSSSEFGDVDAWLQDFSGGNIYYYLKSQVFFVRAVRAF
jgi:hypothetical protein